jgi:hypothetical protein
VSGLTALAARLLAPGLLLLGLAGCGGSGLPVEPNPFTDPRPVTLVGYTGVAMEPALSPDGGTLLFNDSNAPGANTELHWATRESDDLTFTYRGPIATANSNVLDGVPSLDLAGNLYFISLRAYSSTHRYTVHRGSFSAGVVTGVEEVPGLSSKDLGWVIFDAFISRDGSQLWFAEGDYRSGSLGTASLGLAVRQVDGSFVRSSDTLFKAVNLDNAVQYAPAVSADGLELYVTRLTGTTGTTTTIYASRRPNTASPWGPAEPIAPLIGGVIEAAAPSADGRALYFHRAIGASYELARVTRR